MGARCKEVRKVELRSEWDVVFKNNDIHNKEVTMEGTGVLDTPVFRFFENIERVDLEISCRMPWQRTGKLPNYDKVSEEAKEMCYEYAQKVVQLMVANFKHYELNAPSISTHEHIKFDEAWVEPWYESAEFKTRYAEDKRKRAAERVANISKD